MSYWWIRELIVWTYKIHDQRYPRNSFLTLLSLICLWSPLGVTLLGAMTMGSDVSLGIVNGRGLGTLRPRLFTGTRDYFNSIIFLTWVKTSFVSFPFSSTVSAMIR